MLTTLTRQKSKRGLGKCCHMLTKVGVGFELMLISADKGGGGLFSTPLSPFSKLLKNLIIYRL